MARSIWLRQERAARGPVPEHSRAGIAAAGIAIADEGGLPAVSMRRVAATIGTGAASLYRYVQTRDELLELMADAVHAELDLSQPPSGDWRSDLVGLARQMREVYRRHPWLLDVAPNRVALGPHAVEYLEHALAILAGLDVPARVKMESVAMLHGFVTLAVRTEIAVGNSTSGWQAAQAEFLSAVIAAGHHPHLAAATADSDPGLIGEDDLFDRLLPRVLTGLLET
jgi:AcrR family transcriptional regulator